MSKNKYLIPEPTTEISSEYLGTLLITQNANQYACKKKTDKDNWWAIGMIASNGSYWTPVIVSNKREYCRSYSDAFFSESPLSGLMGYFHYKGNTYYSSFSAYGSNLISSDLPNASVPICSESFDGAVEAGEKLIELYVASGGLMPGEGYPTSWVRKLEENVLQKTFAFAHAKTVYTDYANKKTLADKLSEIDTEIGNKANKTEIPTELPANGGNSATVNGHTVNADVPENAVFTDTVYDDTELKEEIAEINSNLESLDTMPLLKSSDLELGHWYNGPLESNNYIRCKTRLPKGTYNFMNMGGWGGIILLDYTKSNNTVLAIIDEGSSKIIEVTEDTRMYFGSSNYEFTSEDFEKAIRCINYYKLVLMSETVGKLNESLGGLSFSVSGTTLSITDGTNTWTLSQ